MKRGFSLIEVILSASLLGLIFLFLLGVLPSTGLMVRRAEHQREATNLAQLLIAQAEATSFEQLENLAGQTLDRNNPALFGELLDPAPLADATRLEPVVTIERMPPVDRLLQMRVTVSWQVGPRTHQVTMLRQLSSVRR